MQIISTGNSVSSSKKDIQLVKPPRRPSSREEKINSLLPMRVPPDISRGELGGENLFMGTQTIVDSTLREKARAYSTLGRR
ncbi:hypothetical protein JTE90_003195 [Oedothorax gibbosus]|uniref:Uncharacterized protein n=1 Tax=Oedothorax gibbosus TaxID=931172 RepID=A0AAV6UR57_9ARAC|nr:hypothetical protein JTE90_003195 [Oedothorax gibbosus]